MDDFILQVRWFVRFFLALLLRGTHLQDYFWVPLRRERHSRRLFVCILDITRRAKQLWYSARAGVAEDATLGMGEAAAMVNSPTATRSTKVIKEATAAVELRDEAVCNWLTQSTLWTARPGRFLGPGPPKD